MIKKIILTTALVVSFFTTHSFATPLEVKLTAKGLGFTTLDGVKVNHGNVVDADQAGLVTSPAIGEGSILTILDNGLAGNPGGGTYTFVTVTANSRTDNFPTVKDYRAGIITLTKQEGNAGKHPDRKEGLGVRAFTVVEGLVGDASTGLRQIDGGTGRAKIEGSKHMSGGVDIKHGPVGGPIDPEDANGADHVDEIVYFDFNHSEFYVDADSFMVRFTDMNAIDHGLYKDRMTVTLTLGDDTVITLSDITLADTSLFSLASGGSADDGVYDLNFAGINAHLGDIFLDDDDVLKQVTIQGIEAYLKNEDKNEWEKSHFFINGLSADVTPVPEPATLSLLVAGGLVTLLRRRRK